MSAAVEAVRRKLLAIEGVQAGGAVFGGLEGFWIDAKLVAELIDLARIQLRLTKPLIREFRDDLRDDPHVELRRNSDWVTVSIEHSADADLVGRLLAAAAPLYLPPAGAVSRPPPTGADLERRRRWH